MFLEKIKKLNFQKFFDLFIYFALIYFATECLNGDNGNYIKYAGETVSIMQKILIVLNDIKVFVWFPKVLYAGVMYGCAYKIFNTLIKNTKVSCFAISTIAVVFSVINYIVIQVRGTAISVADILSVQTALNVSKGLSFNINGFFICAVLLYFVANIFIWKKSSVWNKYDLNDEKNLDGNFTNKEKANENNNKKTNNIADESKNEVEKINLKKRWLNKNSVSMVMSILIIIYMLFFDPYISSLQVWDINLSYKENGVAVTLMRLLKDLNVNKPDDYTSNQIDEILDKYDEEFITYTNNMPNILVVMNESFSDVLSLYDIKTSGDNLQYFHSLLEEENIIKGNMHSSFIGGRTANVEFEFLTQNSITAFPVGSYPYQQYINDTVKESLAGYMNDLGYNTYAIHSWFESGYNRKKIYNLMQFKNIMFKEDMPTLEFFENDYISDSSTYKYWYDIMNNKAKEEKNFTFLLTVQNHLPFINLKDEYTQYVENDDELNAYLNYANESDRALKELIEFARAYDENTIILFFGDHQPNLNLANKYGVKNLYDEAEAQYVVPFFIWANYDIEERAGVEISANFLQNILIDAIGLPENEYDKYTKSIMEKIPVITMQYYIDEVGDRYDIYDSSSPYYNLLSEYQAVVYYQNFE